MNKYQEALDEIKEIGYGKECQIDLLQELVYKTTPKKPTKDNSKGDGSCPSCGNTIFDGSDIFYANKVYRYCQYCSQAIDWSNEDD